MRRRLLEGAPPEVVALLVAAFGEQLRNGEVAEVREGLLSGCECDEDREIVRPMCDALELLVDGTLILQIGEQTSPPLTTIEQQLTWLFREWVPFSTVRAAMRR